MEATSNSATSSHLPPPQVVAELCKAPHKTLNLHKDEWVEYKTVMDSVIRRSGIDKSLFFDLRGNHDNFSVPDIGGSFDFFSKFSIKGQLGRTGNVNSVTLESVGEGVLRAIFTMDHVIGGKFKLGRKIGSGSFGGLYRYLYLDVSSLS
ncbi:hypothetical protein PIB30_054816 [Stylosanthes scabra]|uniref:Uncharacterized protein n=1 Tax=Stylosanthes scabra TaxID=79078 RepID=A0ABU6YHN3_9FABA|nr:hypothetical protein [Stylosanthes scabra]